MEENELSISHIHKLSVFEIHTLLRKYGKIVALYGKRKTPVFEIHAVAETEKEDGSN